MPVPNSSLTDSGRDPAKSKYTSDDRIGHSRQRREAARPVQRVRAFYFCLSSIWGFAVGASAVAVGVRLSGSTVGLDLPVLGLVVGGVAVAVVGGLMAAAAYREARRHRGDH